jgi:MFS family permease
MVGRLRSASQLLARLGYRARQEIHGGAWADAQPPQVRHNLRWFWFDGFFSAASDNIILTYLTLYVLALGASGIQIGLMSSLSSLSATLLLLPGALLAERIGRRKNITVISGGIFSRLMVLLLVFVPLVFPPGLVVVAAIGLSVLRDALANLSLPAWVSLTADIVPISHRGRYFGSRNIYMIIIGMATTLLGGEVITRLGQPLGYQIALGLAFGLGMISTISFARLRDPHPQARVTAQKVELSPIKLLKPLWSTRAFLAFSVTAALWNFSLNIAGPFFNVYMVQNLNASATTVGLLSIVSSLSSLPAQYFFGPLTDRLGPRRVMMITGLLIPFLPFSWLFITASWQIIPLNIFSGFMWGGYSLAAFNILLEVTPHAQRERTTALYQILVALSLAGGAALGGFLVSQFGYKSIFLGSAIGRWVSAGLFARFVPPSLGAPPDKDLDTTPVA